MSEDRRRMLLRLLWLALGAAGVWLFLRFGLKWVGPFLLAYLTAALLEKPVQFFTERCRFRRGFASCVCTLLFFALLATVTALAVWQSVSELEAFLLELPALLSRLWEPLSGLEAGAERYLTRVPEELRQLVRDAMDSASAGLEALPGRITAKLPQWAAAVMKAAPGILLFVVTYAAGTFFIGASYPTVRAFLARQLPKRFRDKAGSVRLEALSALGVWLKAQLRLMTVTFLEMTTAFFLLRIQYAALLGLAVAVIDALPVLGTGTVLIPWALLELMGGAPLRAVALLLLYALAALTRSFLEPRLVGRAAGVHPAASLLAMYAGFRLAGVGGMIGFPLALLVLKQLRDKGYVRLWR